MKNKDLDDDSEKKKVEYDYYDYNENIEEFEGEFEEEDFEEEFEENEYLNSYKDVKSSKRKKSPKKRRRAGKVIVVIAGMLLFIVLAFGGGYLLLNKVLEQANYVPDSETIAINSDFFATDSETKKGDNPVIVMDNNQTAEEMQQVSPEEIQQIKDSIMQNISDKTHYSQDGVLNVLLIGVDTREGEEGNSDSMILLSVNRNKKTVTMNSFMRDLYTGIDGVGVYKLNSAHAIGGASLLLQTIEDNFKIDIDYYAKIDFVGFISVIDTLGGVPMTITDTELPAVNKYIYDLNVEHSWVYDDQLLEQSGDLVLTGKQALAYSRLRSVGNADFERTDRQRKVLSAVMEELRSANMLDLTSVANSLAPYITHNVPKSDLISLILEIPGFMDYQWYSDRIPYDGLYNHYNIGGQGMLVPDWPQTIEKLRGTIFG